MKVTQSKRRSTSLSSTTVPKYRFVQAFDQTPIGITLVDINGQFLYANKAFQKMSGYTLKELHQIGFGNLTHPEDVGKNLRLFKNLVRGKISDYVYEKRNVRKNGEIYWVKITVSKVFDDKDNIECVISLVDDITDQVSATKDLAESEQRFRQLADSMPQIVWSADAEGKIDYYNKQWYDYTGYKKSSEINWRKLMHPDDYNVIHELWLKNIKSGEEYQIEYRLRDRRFPNRYRWFLDKAVCIKDEKGNITKWFGSLTDIDDVKRTMERKIELEEMTASLARQKNELVALNTAKDEFISLASHQLRTPATGVKQYIGLLLGGLAGELEPEQMKLLKVANDSNERQLKIIDDLLKVARADAGKIELNVSECNLVELLYEVIQEQLSTFHDRHQTVVFNDPPDKILAVVDVKLIRMVLENIIDNASKYSPKGKDVTVEIKKLTKKVLIRIKDQGVGIKKTDQANLFLKFSRIDNILSTLVGGTGLGLYWSKKIIDLHRGHIDVHSRPRHGTTFTITLPI